MPITVGYWKIRGLMSNISYQLAYCGIDDYTLNEYELHKKEGDDAGYDGSEWFGVKQSFGFDFPNIPYLIDGDYKMTETLAIHKYLADKYKPNLLGANPEQRGQVSMLEGIISAYKSAITNPCYPF